MIVLVMGVSGAGKTTVGALLAARMGAAFIDADDHHPEANREKMRQGVPLDERDRAGWLADVRRALDGVEGPVILACSALRAAHRRVLLDGRGDVVVVHLTGDPDIIARRLAARLHAFMNPALLPSQIATLEAPADALTLDVGLTPEALVEAILSFLRHGAGAQGAAIDPVAPARRRP